MAMDYVLSLAAEVGAVDDKSIKAAQKIVQEYFDKNKINLDFTTKTAKSSGNIAKQTANEISTAYNSVVQRIKEAQDEISKATSEKRYSGVTKKALQLKELRVELENITNVAKQMGVALNNAGTLDILSKDQTTDIETEHAVMVQLETALNRLAQAKANYYKTQVQAGEANEKDREVLQDVANIYRDQVTEADKAVKSQIEMANKLGVGKQAVEKYHESLKETNEELEIWKKKHDQAKNSQKTFKGGIKDGLQMLSGYQLGFMAVQKAIELFTQGVQQAVQTVKELNVAMTDVQMVAMTTGAETADLANSYSELAKRMGATTQEVAEGASDWLRQGKTLDEVEDLMEATLTMSKVGAIDAGAATEYLTSTINGYKMEAKDAMSIVDKLSAVDLAAATSVEELALALQKTANMARTTGVELDEIIGMIATVSEVTRQAPEIVGTSMKTLFSRMTQVAAGKETSDEGELLNDVEATLNRNGVALRSSMDDWRDMYEVLDEVAGKWADLEDTQRSQIATALGGTRQKEVVLALMENWDKVGKYAKVAEQSTGSASEKMEYYLESIQAATNRLGASWEKFVYSEGMVKLFTTIIDLGTAVIDIFNKIGDAIDRLGWTSENFKNEANDVQSKIQDNIDRINEINSLSWYDRSADILEEKRTLEQENKELERNLELLRSQQMAALEKEIGKGYGATVTSKVTGATTAMSGAEYSDFVNQGNFNPNYFTSYKNTIEDVINIYNELNDEIATNGTVTNDVIQKMDNAESIFGITIRALIEMETAYNDGVAGARKLTNEEQNLVNMYRSVQSAFEAKKQAAKEAEEALVSNAQKLIENEKDADKAREALTEFVKQEIILNQSKLDLSQQIDQLNAVAQAAGAASEAIGGLSQVKSVIRGGQPFFEYNGKYYRFKSGALSAYWDDLNKLTKPGRYYVDGASSGAGSGSSSDPNEALKKAAQNQIKLINIMKDKIKDQIDEINDKWDDEADALEKANDKLEQQIEYQKLLEAMAKAKSQKKMIYKDGRFQYLEDTEAISEAQSNLDEFYRKKDLQDQKDYIEEQRKLELGDLEDQQKYLEDKVDYWNDYIDRLDSEFSSYMDIFDDFLKKQKDGYFSDLEALKNYVESKELLAKRAAAASGTGSGYTGTTGTNQPQETTVAPVKKNHFSLADMTTDEYAEGTTYAKGGLSVVGEKGAELRVINRGDGIIPADVTKNLWKWGSIDPDKAQAKDKTQVQTYDIDIANVSLPDVTKPEEFISGIRNLALQRAYNR